MKTTEVCSAQPPLTLSAIGLHVHLQTRIDGLAVSGINQLGRTCCALQAVQGATMAAHLLFPAHSKASLLTSP